MEVIRHNNRLMLLRGFLQSEECCRLVDFSEATGYEEARVNAGPGPQQVRKDIRNNDRLFWDNKALAQQWFELAQATFPIPAARWRPCGLNERLRFYRYRPGQRFAPHRDGSYERNANEMSWYTFMVYLNDDYEGGKTRFDFTEGAIEVNANAGDALLFHHDILHEGQEVTAGTKYVLRTDVMYRREQ